MSRKEILERLKAPLPVEGGASEPSISAFIERLEEVFDEDFDIDIQATAQGVRCEITIDQIGFDMKRSAIGSGDKDAIKKCCYLM